MSFFARLFRKSELTKEEKQKKGERLDAKRRHLRGKLSKVQGELRQLWTKYRVAKLDASEKKQVKAKIKHLEAERKALVKEMVKLQTEMKQLGFKAAAGYVEVH
ncbi:MAG TPA: hypothetical protein VM370_10150 [Candidatus Thermoplasmatota archaeon]|nr:hypothetical protein [Candidatus Thermoplasmatota archaeon]